LLYHLLFCFSFSHSLCQQPQVKRIYIGLPNGSTRVSMILHLLRAHRYKLSKAEYPQIEKITEGYSGSDITALGFLFLSPNSLRKKKRRRERKKNKNKKAKEAALEPIREMGSKIKDAEEEKVRPIVLQDLIKASKKIRPSVSQSSLEAYRAWNEEFGCSG